MLNKIEGCDGTIAYLEVLKFVIIAYVREDTNIYDRIFYASYCVQFIRMWRQDLHNKKIKTKYFITQNTWDGLELNLIWIIRMAIDCVSQDIAEQSSQQCEKFFRTVRSFTGVFSTITNISMKTFVSRVQKIQCSEELMVELSDKIHFPKMQERKARKQREKETPNIDNIKVMIESGIFAANERCNSLGIECEEIELELFLKKSHASSFLIENEIEDEIQNEEVAYNYVDEDDEDEEPVDKLLTLQNIHFTSDKTGF